MSEQNEYDIIPNQENQAARRRFPTWGWLVVALGVVLLAFAAGMAFATYANRMNGSNQEASSPTPASSPNALAGAPVTATLSAVLANPPNATAQATVAVSPTSTLTTTGTPTVTAPAVCASPVVEQFAPLYLQSELGCPTDGGAVVWAAWESFERGAMLWRSDTDRAYAFLGGGAWLTIDERWDNKEIPSRGDPPPGLVTPVRGFGYVWSIRDDLFQRLGWATTEEKGFCALVQSFEGGFILQSDTVEFCREQLYNQARSPDWVALRIVATYDGIWRSQ